MKEHLITTKNSDGSVIPNVTDSTSWGSLNKALVAITITMVNINGLMVNYIIVIQSQIYAMYAS